MICLKLQVSKGTVLVWSSLEAGPETRVLGQAVYLGGDPQKHGWGEEK